MNWKNRTWKYATGLAVLLIILNPETAQLTLFIDAIGQEMFVLLFEVQVIALLSGILNSQLIPRYTTIIKLTIVKSIVTSSKNIFSTGEQLVTSLSAPAVIMNLLVFTTFIGTITTAP